MSNNTDNIEVPPLEIERWEIGRLKKHPKNYNRHPIGQVEQLADSLRTRGFRKPIVVQVSTGYVVAGNGVFAAALHLGLPEVYVAPWDCSDDDALKYMIADNELAKGSKPNQGVLTDLLRHLADKAEGLEALGKEGLGFTFERLQVRLGPGKRNRNKPPAAPKKPRTKPGTLYALGPHRLLCGDSTKEASFVELMQGDRADLVFTDPPYGVSYTGSNWGADHDGLDNDDLTGSDLVDRLLAPAFKGAAAVARRRAAFYIWHADKTSDEFKAAIKAANLDVKATIIWAKTNGWGNQHYRQGHEPCFYCARAGESPHFYGDRFGSTVWRLSVPDGDDESMVLGPGAQIVTPDGQSIFMYPARPKSAQCRRIDMVEGGTLRIQLDDAGSTVWELARDSRAEYVHPTQKPTALAERAIANSTEAAGIVLDPFGGSGSTLIAAEETGRVARLIELAPKFCDVIVERWEKRTRRKAEVINNPED